jgi:hypothetical protein
VDSHTDFAAVHTSVDPEADTLVDSVDVSAAERTNMTSGVVVVAGEGNCMYSVMALRVFVLVQWGGLVEVAYCRN